jgi:hypothetical protein
MDMDLLQRSLGLVLPQLRLVQMDQLQGDGCLHHNITLALLTPSRLFECELERESPNRKRRRTPGNSVAGDGPPTKKKTAQHRKLKYGKMLRVHILRDLPTNCTSDVYERVTFRAKCEKPVGYVLNEMELVNIENNTESTAH